MRPHFHQSAFRDYFVLAPSVQVFPLDESIDNINDTYWTLRAEEVHTSEPPSCPLPHHGTPVV